MTTGDDKSAHRMVLAYDGTAYHGWQAQRDVDTVSGRFSSILEQVTGEHPRVRAAGRTDAGVHAHGQVIAFELNAEVHPVQLMRECNAHLPSDIAVVAAAAADPGFDPRRDAWRRTYRYLVGTAAATGPVSRRYCWQLRSPLEIAPMRQAAAAVVGTHDFAAFGASPGGGASTTRTVEVAEITDREGMVRVEITADAFLRGMLRSLVGALVLVGQGRLQLREFGSLLGLGSERVTGWRPAPARGLHQWRVEYHRPAMLGVHI